MKIFYNITLLLIILAFVYTYSLDQVPVHLNRDELGFSLNAYSIAKTGFDENGRFFPLYFWHLGVIWATPIIVYTTAIFLGILPFSEITIRLPSVLIGLINIVLIYFLAKRVFNSERFGILAAVFLATIPVHYIQSRILLDNLFPVPFVLGWILLLHVFFSRKNLWQLFFATFLLGIGVHSYHATKVLMPIYLVITFLIVLLKYKGKKTVVLIPLIAFILPLLPLIPWLTIYPDTLTDQVRYIGLYDSRLNLIQGLLTLLKPEIIIQRLIVYLEYFNPEFLFFKGDSSLIHSTGKIGVFLLPFAILLPIGIYQAFKKRSWFNWLLIAGFFTAPCAAAFVGNEYRASKELFILPFAALLSTLAIHFLLNTHLKIWKTLAFFLIAVIPLQFGFFLHDYFNGYRERSYVWFDYDISGAEEAVLTEESKRPADFINFDNRIYYYTDRYWKFILIKHHREDLIHKISFFDPLVLNYFQPNTIVLYRYDHISYQLRQIPPLRLIKTVVEPDGTVSLYIYRN